MIEFLPAATGKAFPVACLVNQSSIPVLRGHGIVPEEHSPHRRQPGAGGSFHLPAPETGAAVVLPQRALVAHLAVGGGHHPDGRTHLGVLRPGRGLPLHRLQRHHLHRLHRGLHPLHDHPAGGDRRDPGAPRAHRRRGLFLLLPGPGPPGVLRGGGLHHGGLHPHRLYLRGERGAQCHLVFPPAPPHGPGPGPGHHLGRGRAQHPGDQGERPGHLHHLYRCRPDFRHPDHLRHPGPGRRLPGAAQAGCGSRPAPT